MSGPTGEPDDLVRRLLDEGGDVDAVEEAMVPLDLEAPSYGYGAPVCAVSPSRRPGRSATCSRQSTTQPTCTAGIARAHDRVAAPSSS